jgi:hypothetical protein
MVRSATTFTVSVSVALLLPGVGSLTPAGAAMLAVLETEPVALADTVAFTVKVAVPPLSRLTLADMLPLPLAGQLEPALATQDQVPIVSPDGAVSATVAPVTALGPLLVATIVYTVPAPALTLVTPSVFVIDRSATGVAGVMVSVSVALLLAGFASVTPAGADTLAVFTRLPVALELMLAFTV